MRSYALLLAITSLSTVCSATKIAINATNLCSVCDCDRATKSVNCRFTSSSSSLESDAARQIFLQSIPHSYRKIRVSGAESVAVSRGAITASSHDVHLALRGVERVAFETGGVAIEGDTGGRAFVEVEGAAEVEVSRGAVSGGLGGDFSLQIVDCGSVRLAEHGFGVLTAVRISDVDELHLAPSALRPTILTESLDLEIVLEDVRLLPALPERVFASAKSVTLRRCQIREVSGNAFYVTVVERVRFEECSVDRILSGAFPDGVFIQSLSFENCTLTSVSEKSVMSASQELRVVRTEINSMSKAAFNCHAAKVVFRSNLFRTLGSESLRIKTWSDFAMTDNKINFLERGALAGIANPDVDVGANVSFVFSRNNVSYANMDGLKLGIESARVARFAVEGNNFGRECDCDFGDWIDSVCGSVGPQYLSMRAALKNTSTCSVLDEFYLGCFGGLSHVSAAQYKEVLCTVGPGDPASECQVKTPLDDLWQLFKEQVQVDTNKGLLLVILLAAVSLSLVVSICTLLRWIVYTLQLRAKVRGGGGREMEWNFTKIEERRNSPTSSPCPATDHYESLPLTREEEVELIEEEDEDGNPLEGHSGKKEREEQQAKRLSYLHDNPPKLTFYDEMIDLLKERLDDPDNYAVVADTATPATSSSEAATTSNSTSGNNESLYMDPKNREEGRDG